MTANFMFEEIENIQHEFMSHDSLPLNNTNQQSFNTPNSSGSSGGNLPTEAQLTLLCLDYLRSLRRSYQNPQDLLNGEGLHADYISLAIWSLSRAFVSPDKLKFGEPKVSTIIEESGSDSKKGKKKKKKIKEIQLVGGGGLGGVEDECVGNDSFYRLVKKGIRGDGDNDDNNFCTPSPKEVFALTENIKLPSMKDITNEVLLSYNNNDNDAAKSKDEEECPIYEQNDMHLSNSHRFYLFNGMASGDDNMGMTGANKEASPSINSKGGASGAGGPSVVDGGPLTLVDLTSVALLTLNARIRIEAEREVVQNPLFESFIQAAGEKGFFNEKKLNDDDVSSPEEEEYRQRLLYENKYRKVVAKFRSKLAVREEQQMLNNNGGGGVNGGGGGGWSPRSGQRALVNVHSVSDRLEMRRDRIIEQVKGYRVEVEEEEVEEDAPLVSEQPVDVGGANDWQVIPQRSESDERIQANVMMERVMTEVERAPVNQRIMTEVERAPVDQRTSMMTEVERAPVNPPSPMVKCPPSPVVKSLPSPPKASKDPPPSPDRAAKVPPQSPAAKLPFYQEAEELYTAALKISPAGPNSHVYYSNRAAAKLSLGDAESSIQDSESALTMRPDYVKARSRLGLAHYASGRYEEAVMNYEAALDLEPGNEWVKNQYEKARRMLVKVDEEEEKALTEGKEDDEWPSPFVNKSKEARAIVVRQADEYKENGNAYMKIKKYEEALHQYNLAIDTSADGPNSHIYYSNRAAAYFHLGKYKEAADDCLASIELDDSYEKAHSRYGLSLFFLGDYEGSIHAYRKSLDLAPDNKASLSYLAKAKASLIGRAAENEMQEEMAKKLNLGKRQESEEMELESK